MTNASILRILAHATPTPTSRSKGQKSKSRGGGILWRPPSRSCRTACFYYYFTGCMYVGKKLYIYKKLRSSKTRVTSDFGCCGKYIAMCNVVPLCFGSCLGLYFSASSVASQSKGISRSWTGVAMTTTEQLQHQHLVWNQSNESHVLDQTHDSLLNWLF